jgi:hypothetical protein
MSLLLSASVAGGAACRSHAESTAVAKADATVDLAWTLSERRVGPTTLIVTLREAGGSAPTRDGGLTQGAPITGATVRVEALMTHPGMAPIEATAVATGLTTGEYRADFAFTMAGDWVLLVTATLPDGRRIERRIDIANVRPAA